MSADKTSDKAAAELIGEARRVPSVSNEHRSLLLARAALAGAARVIRKRSGCGKPGAAKSRNLRAMTGMVNKARTSAREHWTVATESAGITKANAASARLAFSLAALFRRSPAPPLAIRVHAYPESVC